MESLTRELEFVTRILPDGYGDAYSCGSGHGYCYGSGNSRIIVSTDGSRVLVDKKFPRTEIEITRAEIG